MKHFKINTQPSVMFISHSSKDKAIMEKFTDYNMEPPTAELSGFPKGIYLIAISVLYANRLRPKAGYHLFKLAS